MFVLVVCLLKLTTLFSIQLRWTASSKNFQNQIINLVGNVLLATGFLSYSGPFNQEYRNLLLQLWKKEMDNNEIPYSKVSVHVLFWPYSSPCWEIICRAFRSRKVHNWKIIYRLSHSIKFLINKKSEQLTTELLNQYVLNSSLHCQAFHNWYVGHCSGKSEREMHSEICCPGRNSIIQETK